MALSPGTRLGPYEIEHPLAAGGMGQIYRARDTRLSRVVAIKVVADAHHDRADLRERFRVEARAIATLNHSHICQIYDVGEYDGSDYFVMELIEGETLAARLRRGPIPFEQALTIARQIAGALGAAHRQGITHRDVKPSNVMLTREGVKLLDFGLARLRQPDPAAIGAHSTMAPAGPITSTGMAMGTWQYMAPEQVRGEAVDSRTDVFALGALIFEITTGRPAFNGATPQDLAAAILDTDPPPVSSVMPSVPKALDHVVRTCLAKASDDRWHSGDEVARALEMIAAAGNPAEAGANNRQRRTFVPPLLILGGAAAALALVVMIGWRPSSAVPAGVIRSSIPIQNLAIASDVDFAFARDGRSFVFCGVKADTRQLYRYDFETGVVSPIAGTEGGRNPFFSPDGKWLGFAGTSNLMKVPAGGGGPIPLAPIAVPLGASWGDDDTIIFGDKPESGLLRIPAAGGTPQTVTTIAKEDAGNDHRSPQFLPGSRGVLYAVGTGPEDSSHIDVLDLRTGAVKTLVRGGFSFRYVPTGYLAYTRDSILYAMPFDADRLEVTGPPFEVAHQVDDWDGTPRFDFSKQGDLLFVAAAQRGPQQRLALVDLHGKVDYLGAQGAVGYPRFSPDGSRIAYQLTGAKNNGWVYDLQRGTQTRVTFGRYHFPVWTPDGRLTFGSGGPGNTRIVIRSADGTGTDEVLTDGGASDQPRSWTPDGRTLVFERFKGLLLSDLMTLALPSRKVTPLMAAPYSEHQPRLSPDGRWLAYATTEDGSIGQIYIRPFGVEGRRVQVSVAPANFGTWSPDGRHFYFRGPGPDRPEVTLWVVDVTTSPQLSVSKPRPMFANTGFFGSFDLSPDGTHFVMTQRDSRPPTTQFELVQNWSRVAAATR